MASQLYINACVALGPDLAAWEAVLASIRDAFAGGKYDGGDGVADLIENEHQLSDDPGCHACTWLAEFLRDVSRDGRGLTDAGLKTAYDAVCDHHLLRGRPVTGLPGELLHYRSTEKVIDALYDALQGTAHEESADKLRGLYNQVVNGVPGSSWNKLDRRLRLVLHRAGLPNRPVKYTDHTFVTFEGASHAERERSGWMEIALALPQVRPQDRLCELRFNAPGGGVVRYPTCGDAHWFAPFRSAPATEPHGWSRPHDGDNAKRQPEGVMPTPSYQQLVDADAVRVLTL